MAEALGWSTIAAAGVDHAAVRDVTVEPPGTVQPAEPSPGRFGVRQTAAERWYARDLRDAMGDGMRADFDSAHTDRLNAAHWSTISDASINDDLADSLSTMRARSTHEAWNNGTIEGLILQHGIAVFGEDAPLLELHGDNEDADGWCASAEAIWEDWTEYCDAARQHTLGSRLKNLWNRGGWTAGEFLDQLVFDRKSAEPLQLRLHAIEPQRLASPAAEAVRSDVVLGVRRDEFRRPIRYHIHDTLDGFGAGRWINAWQVVHGYEALEPGQARGVPWAQTGLPVAADLRDYDDQVMDAARQQADMAVLATTDHPDAPYIEHRGSAPFRRRRINHVAPGWNVRFPNASQPAAQYKDYRQERMGDLGRGKGVPSMVTRLDARDHNYSSARFDRGLLHESAKHLRATMYRPLLNRLVRMVLAEAVLSRRLPMPPPSYRIAWIWPAMPQVDEAKSATAENRYLANGTQSYSAACAERHGVRASDVIRIRQRDARQLAAAGLPSVHEATQGKPAEADKPDEVDGGTSQ